jgi:adenylate cyclase
MFTDLQGFTQATEHMAPEQVLLWLSEYFNRMTQAVQMHQGTIDKYIGDSVMGLWNAPVPDADHVANACRAALACRTASRTLGFDGSGPRLRTRIGLHTGMAMVGNVGSQDRMQYTAMGAMVNLASRLEGLNKAFGTELLVTQAVVDAVAGQFVFRPFGPVLVAGTTVPLVVFEMREDTDGLALWMQAYHAWLAHDWARADAAFSDYAQQYPHDLAAPLFLATVRTFCTDSPPPDWDGVMRFTSK